jgi:transcriptional regulator with XRE-family HTH domain
VEPKRRKKPASTLQELFLKRVQEELDRQGLSRNALAGRVGGPSQTTFNDVMQGHDPRLKTVSEIATALGVQPWELFTERRVGESRRANGTVQNFPAFPSIIGRPDKSAKLTGRDRKKRGV